MERGGDFKASTRAYYLEFDYIILASAYNSGEFSLTSCGGRLSYGCQPDGTSSL